MMITAAELAAQFDGSFARAQRDATPEVDVLVLELAAGRYVLRVSEVAGVFVDRAITRIPTTRRELVGVAGIRGAIVPVFDLAAVLGHPPATSPRWLVIAAGSAVGLAFERFGGHRRVPHAAIGDVVECDGSVLPVIDLASVLGAFTTGK